MKMNTERKDKSRRGKTPSHVKRDGLPVLRLVIERFDSNYIFQFSVSNWD